MLSLLFGDKKRQLEKHNNDILRREDLIYALSALRSKLDRQQDRDPQELITLSGRVVYYMQLCQVDEFEYRLETYKLCPVFKTLILPEKK